MDFEKIDYNGLLQKLMDQLVVFGPKVIAATLVFLIGWWVINIIRKLLRINLDRGKLDESLKLFFLKLLTITLRILLVISVASMIGIETTSFIAMLGAAGLAVGLALQGSLANFAGGVLILVFRPFKVGDFIEAQSFLGTVEQIDIIYTILKTPHGQKIVIPNGALSNGSIKNFSAHPTRRIDLTYSISYTDSIPKAKEILNEIYTRDERILKDPAIVIGVAEMSDSSIDIIVKAWCNSPEYWNLFHDLQEKVKLTFDEKGITIPFPQRDVHLFNQK